MHRTKELCRLLDAGDVDGALTIAREDLAEARRQAGDLAQLLAVLERNESLAEAMYAPIDRLSIELMSNAHSATLNLTLVRDRANERANEADEERVP